MRANGLRGRSAHSVVIQLLLTGLCYDSTALVVYLSKLLCSGFSNPPHRAGSDSAVEQEDGPDSPAGVSSISKENKSATFKIRKTVILTPVLLQSSRVHLDKSLSPLSLRLGNCKGRLTGQRASEPTRLTRGKRPRRDSHRELTSSPCPLDYDCGAKTQDRALS